MSQTVSVPLDCVGVACGATVAVLPGALLLGALLTDAVGVAPDPEQAATISAAETIGTNRNFLNAMSSQDVRIGLRWRRNPFAG
jgi:hypothetical protein